MIRIKSRLYFNCVVAFFVLVIWGYDLLTTLAIPFFQSTADYSRYVTIPYRVAVLILSIFLLVCNPKDVVPFKFRGDTALLAFFWLMYAIRIPFDILTRNVYELPKVFEFVFAICIPIFFTTVKTIPYLDIKVLSRWMFYVVIIYLGACLLNNDALITFEESEHSRIQGNVSSNSISFGHSCLSCMIVLFFSIRNSNHRFFFKLLVYLLIALSLFFLLKAGSRGPLIAFIVILEFVIVSNRKYRFLSIVVSSFILFVLLFYYEYILQLVALISPTTSSRMLATITDSDSSGRDLLYSNAIELFLNNPFIGSKYITDYNIYSHNFVLDAFMGLGIIGGGVVLVLIIKAVIASYRLIYVNSVYAFMGLMCIQQIMLNMFSGCFYMNPTLSLLLVVTYYCDYSIRKGYLTVYSK